MLARRWFPYALLLCATTTLRAEVVEDQFSLPVTVADLNGTEVTRDVLVTTFLDDAAAKPYTLLVLGHGRPGTAPAREKMGRVRLESQAHWFARQGFLVAVPTRIGYGATASIDIENSGPDCASRNYHPGSAAAAKQTLAVIERLRERKDVALDRLVLVGQSVGGLTTIAASAQNPKGLLAAVNFSGGNGGDPIKRPGEPCSPGELKRLFGDFGKTVRSPTLWLYTENDQFFAPAHTTSWFEAFRAAGGQGEHRLFPPHGKNGHRLFYDAPEIWQPVVLDFLKAQGALPPR